MRIGRFPLFTNLCRVKVAETAWHVADGADEIDVVLNVGLFLEKNMRNIARSCPKIKRPAVMQH